MIVEADNPIESNITSVVDFKLNASREAFVILSEKLYSDKILAVVRELGCNAYDSHVAAGKKDVPFTVTIPTVSNDTFEIRDYGVGMSEEDIYSLYTTYFSSSKIQSNDFIGAFGLGSKSPFAYSDSFTVESYFGGRRRVFLMFLDNGLPKVTKLIDEEDNESPTGLKVSVKVNNESDYGDFYTACIKVFLFFDVKPNFLGIEKDSIDAEFDIIHSIERLSGDDDNLTIEYYRFKKQRESSCRRLFNQTSVIMGNICYPLDSSKLGRKDREALDELLTLVNTGFVLRVPLGSLSITPSRESLSYDSKTTEYISGILDNFLGKIVKFKLEEAKYVKGFTRRALYLKKEGLFNFVHKRASAYSMYLRKFEYGEVGFLFGCYVTLPSFLKGQIYSLGYRGRKRTAHLKDVCTPDFLTDPDLVVNVLSYDKMSASKLKVYYTEKHTNKTFVVNSKYVEPFVKFLNSLDIEADIYKLEDFKVTYSNTTRSSYPQKYDFYFFEGSVISAKSATSAKDFCANYPDVKKVVIYPDKRSPFLSFSIKENDSKFREYIFLSSSVFELKKYQEFVRKAKLEVVSYDDIIAANLSSIDVDTLYKCSFTAVVQAYTQKYEYTFSDVTGFTNLNNSILGIIHDSPAPYEEFEWVNKGNMSDDRFELISKYLGAKPTKDEWEYYNSIPEYILSMSKLPSKIEMKRSAEVALREFMRANPLTMLMIPQSVLLLIATKGLVDENIKIKDEELASIQFQLVKKIIEKQDKEVKDETIYVS